MQRKIYFRADAGVDIGYGHFIRTLALADMLKDDFGCFFVTQTPTLYQKTEVAKVCSLIEVPASEEKFSLFLEMLQGDEIVVLDNYFYDTDYQRKIRAKGCKLVCVDDMHDKHYVADVVINHGITDANLFSVESYSKLCLGFDWALLRREFLHHKRNHICTDQEVRNVLVCFGGVDINDFTGNVIKVLNRLPEVKSIIAIANNSYNRGADLNSTKVCFKYNLQASEIADLFDWADYTFVSASTICLEAVSCHVPVAAGYYVDNQKEFYEELSSKNYIYPLGDLFSVCWETEASNAIKYRTQKRIDTIVDIPNNYIQLFDSLFDCPNYTIDGLIFIDYRNLTKDQHLIVWKARVHDNVRCWMNNAGLFSFEEHCAFVDSLSNLNNAIYWGVFDGVSFIGAVNIHKEEGLKRVERGIFVSPDYLGKSYGNYIEKVSEQLFRRLGISTIKAKVLKTNVRSLKFHEKNRYIIENMDERYFHLIKKLDE